MTADDKGSSEPSQGRTATDTGTLFRQQNPGGTHNPNAASGAQPVPARAPAPTSAPNAAGGNSGVPSSSGWHLTNPSQWDDATRPALQIGDTLKERFVLEEVVGRGGMGTVFRARDLRKEEAQDRYPYVAVKILNADFQRHPESLKLLQREARKAQQLAHPHIVAVHDFDRDGANVFIIMELLEGVSLDQFIKQNEGRGHPFADVIRIVKALADALGYAHQKGIVHLDFKPANAFLTNDGSIKVLDFGIARAKPRADQPEAEQTRFNVGSLGAMTPSYASLEMLESQEPDPRDDIYALACVTYELLAGKHPFGRQPAQFAHEFNLRPARPRGFAQRKWQALLRGLALKRADRTPTTAQFVAELDAQEHSSRLRWGVAAGAGAVVSALAVFAWVNRAERNETPAGAAVPTQPSAPAATEAAAVAQALPEAKPPLVKPEDEHRPRENTLEELQLALVQQTNANNVAAAMNTLETLRQRLPAGDAYLREQAPKAIAAANLRLAERALQAARYQAASDYIAAGQRLSADLAGLTERKEAVVVSWQLDNTLRSATTLVAADLQNKLAAVKRAAGSVYPAIETNLATTLADRIAVERRRSTPAADSLLTVARQVFGYQPAILALNEVPESAVSSSTPGTGAATMALPIAPPSETSATSPTVAAGTSAVTPDARASETLSAPPPQPPLPEKKPEKKTKPAAIATF